VIWSRNHLQVSKVLVPSKHNLGILTLKVPKRFRREPCHASLLCLLMYLVIFLLLQLMGKPWFLFQCASLVFTVCSLLKTQNWLLSLPLYLFHWFLLYFFNATPCCSQPMCIVEDIGNVIYVHKPHFFHYVFVYVVFSFHFNFIRNINRSNVKYKIIIHIDGVLHYIWFACYSFCRKSLCIWTLL